MYVIGTTCFDECFLFHVITERHYFLYKFIVTQSFFATTTFLLSLKQVFWKKSVFYLRYLHNNIAMLLIPKVQHKASTSKIFLTVFFIDNVFLHSIISWVFHIFHSKFSMLIKGYNQIFMWRVFVFTNCFYKLRAKSQSIWHLYKQCLYKIIKFVNSKFYKKKKKKKNRWKMQTCTN